MWLLLDDHYCTIGICKRDKGLRNASGKIIHCFHQFRPVTIVIVDQDAPSLSQAGIKEFESGFCGPGQVGIHAYESKACFFQSCCRFGEISFMKYDVLAESQQSLHLSSEVSAKCLLVYPEALPVSSSRSPDGKPSNVSNKCSFLPGAHSRMTLAVSPLYTPSSAKAPSILSL